jgi:hypothetical protein
MAELDFAFEGAEVVPFAATPQLALAVRIDAPPGERIHSAHLRCQVLIEAAKRRYSPAEEALLGDVFGERDRWRDTLRALPWTEATLAVPAFEGSTRVTLPVVCSVDLALGPAKYLYALESGSVPLTLLFSGTVFAEVDGGLSVSPVPWDRAARGDVPVALVRKAADLHHPGSACLALRHDVVDRLYRYRLARGFTSFEQALEALLEGSEPR